jgi:hypothetical protein
MIAFRRGRPAPQPLRTRAAEWASRVPVHGRPRDERGPAGARAQGRRGGPHGDGLGVGVRDAEARGGIEGHSRVPLGPSGRDRSLAPPFEVGASGEVDGRRSVHRPHRAGHRRRPPPQGSGPASTPRRSVYSRGSKARGEGLAGSTGSPRSREPSPNPRLEPSPPSTAGRSSRDARSLRPRRAPG